MSKGLKVIHAMNALGYKADPRGVCYGIEYMAIQAAVRGKFDQFKTRMDCIHSYENSDSFLTDWNNALTLKKPDTDNHNSKKSLDVDELVNDIDVILDDKDENNSDIELNNLIDHLEQNYNSPVEPEVLRSMRSFFEGVEIYMQGELYPEFFDAIKELTPKGQDFRASSMLASDNPKEMEPFDKLKVAHNKASLVQYLNDLCALKNDAIEGMSIGLNTYGHAMALVRNNIGVSLKLTYSHKIFWIFTSKTSFFVCIRHFGYIISLYVYNFRIKIPFLNIIEDKFTLIFHYLTV
jgi:hypothetical protein